MTRKSCDRCRKHKPSRRIQCKVCSRLVGPGCDPEQCLLIEFEQASKKRRYGLCADWPHCGEAVGKPFNQSLQTVFDPTKSSAADQHFSRQPGLIAHWVIPPRMDHDIKWLICYVILSRVPSLMQLRSIGINKKIREIIEAGPPDGVVQTFNTLFAQKIEDTQDAAMKAKQRLAW